METEEKIKSNTFYRAKEIVKAALGLDNGYDHIREWKNFRNALIAEDKINSFWSDETFKWGFQMVCNTLDVLIQTNFNYNIHDKEDGKICDEENDENYSLLTEQFLYDGYDSTVKLIEALEIISVNPRAHDMDVEDIKDFRIILKTIAACQWDCIS